MPKKKFHTFVYLITKKIVRLIIENENISELDAIQDFYQSETYLKCMNITTLKRYKMPLMTWMNNWVYRLEI